MLSVNDLGFGSPSLSAEQVSAIAFDHFGVCGSHTNLGGERDQNTRITTADGHRYVLKIADASEDPARVDLQVKALTHIETADPELPVPRMIRGADGDFVQRLEIDGQTYRARMLTFLAGIPYSSGPFPTGKGLFGIGAFMARLDRALVGFSHPASNTFMPWDIGNGRVFSEQFRALVPDEATELCAGLLEHIEQVTYPKLKSIRRQVIHQDGHGGNLLRASAECEAVSGVIDFGDMVHGPLVSDVAISASHFMETGDDPYAIAAFICAGFNSVTPLAEEERELLLDMVLTRQVLTLQLYEFRRLHMPHSPPQDVDEKPRIIRSLGRLAGLDRDRFNENLRQACRKNHAGDLL